MTAERIAIAYDCLFPYTTGGGERAYRGFAEEIVAAGRQVDYLTAIQWDRPLGEDLPFAVVPVSRRLKLYTAEGVRRIPAALQFAAGLFRELRRRRRDYDAVFVSALPVFNLFAVRLALLGTGTRIVVDWLEVWPRSQWVAYSGRVTGTIAWALQKLAIAASPLATCHSQLTARRLRSEGLRSEPLVSSGLIQQVGEPSEAVAAAAPPYVLYAGRHIPDKQVEIIPAAIKAARRDIPDLRLVILGSGPSTPAVRAAIAAADADSWTSLPGFVEQDELEELMAEATCLLNPSRREGYGLVVVESAGHGTPVVLVADDDNAAIELVEPGRNGYVARSTAAEDVARAIVEVADGGIGLRRSTEAWYREAITTRTIRRTVERLLAAIDAPTGPNSEKEQKT